MKSKKPSVSIKVWSDFICPWCYIAKCRLQRLKSDLSSEINLEISIEPFQLYPEIPVEGIEKSILANRTKPGMGRSLRNEAAIENISLNYNLIEYVPNSFEAHRLIYLIPEASQKLTVAHTIFQSYFEKGLDIGNLEKLKVIGRSRGLSDEVLFQFQNIENGRTAIKNLIREANERHIRSVPVLTLDHKFQIPGLHSYYVWEQYIRRTLRKK